MLQCVTLSYVCLSECECVCVVQYWLGIQFLVPSAKIGLMRILFNQLSNKQITYFLISFVRKFAPHKMFASTL